MEHHGGHSWLLSCLSAGAAVVVASKFDAEEILGKIERYAVTHIILLPPSVYCRLSREAAPGARDLSSVRIVQSAAGAMTPSIVERRRHFDAIVEGGIRFRHAKNPFGGSADEIFRNDVAR